MDEEYWDGFRDRLEQAAKASEVWELVKSYEMDIRTREQELISVVVELQRCSHGWALFGQRVDEVLGEEPRPRSKIMLTNLESSPDAALRYAHWEKLQWW
jgi:hypothetical protein